MPESFKRNEVDITQELEYVHGQLYFQMLELLEGGTDTTQIEELLRTVPEEFREKYRRFVGKFKEFFQKQSDVVTEFLERNNSDSLVDVVVAVLIRFDENWSDKSLTVAQKQDIAAEFKQTAIMSRNMLGILEFSIPRIIFRKIRGASDGFVINLQNNETRFTFQVTPDDLDKKSKQETHIHELQHMIWNARLAIVQKKEGNFSEFGSETTQRNAASAFSTFQNEVVAYFVQSIVCKTDGFKGRLRLSKFFDHYAYHLKLGSLFYEYLTQVRSYLRFGGFSHPTYDEMKVYLYPLMAASDYKDMINRLERTKEKYFKKVGVADSLRLLIKRLKKATN